MATRTIRIGNYPDYRDEIRGTLSEILALPMSQVNRGTFANPEDVEGCTLEMSPVGWKGSLGAFASEAERDTLTGGNTGSLYASGVTASVSGGPVTWQGAAGGGWVPHGNVSARHSISIVGDSIAAYGQSSTGFPTVQSIPTWGFGLAGVQYDIQFNRAVGGTAIQDMISSQLNSAISDDTGVIWIHSGVNNLNPSIDATNPTVASIVGQMSRVIALAAASKELVIVDALTPLAPDSISGAFARASDIPLVNAGYAAVCSRYKNVIFNDIYTPLASSAPGIAIPLVNVSADGIHLTAYGAYLAGTATKDALAKVAAFRKASKTQAIALLPQIVGNTGTSVPGSGTITGDVPTNYTVNNLTNSSGVVTTCTIDQANKPNTVKIRIQNGNAGTCVVRFYTTTTSYLVSSLAIGDSFRAVGKIKVLDGSTGVKRHDYAIYVNSNATYTPSSMMNGNSAATETDPTFPPNGGYTVLQCAPTYTLPVTPTTAIPLVTLAVAAGGDATFEISDLGYEKVIRV